MRQVDGACSVNLETSPREGAVRRVAVLLNARSGAFSNEETAEQIRVLFRQHGTDADVRLIKTGETISSHVTDALNEGADILVAAGGDGTISTVAAAAVRTKKTLGVLPLGTLNNFSKDLGIPQDLTEAVRVIVDGKTVEVDVAEGNERTFINNSSIGLYPRIVRHRTKQQRLGRGKWWAVFWATLRVFRISPFLKVRITLDGKQFLRKTPFVFVGNNEYEMELYNIGRRPELDQGVLSVYFLHRGGRIGLILLILHTLLGQLRQWKDFEEVKTDEIIIQTRKKRLPVAFDGEVRLLKTPLHYRIRPKQLKVRVPVQTELKP